MGNTGTCACKHGNHDGSTIALAHAVDVHVRCTCPQDSLRAPPIAPETSCAQEPRACSSYTLAGCEQFVKRNKCCKKNTLSNACPCDDTDTLSHEMTTCLQPNSNIRALTKNVDSCQCSQKALMEDHVDILQCPSRGIPNNKVGRGSCSPSQADFSWQYQEKVGDAEDTDATRYADAAPLGCTTCAPATPDLRCLSHESLDLESGSDNETEQEPMPWLRPRRGGICCGGVTKSTFTPPSYTKGNEANSKLIRSLRNSALFNALRPSELETVSNTMELETVRKGKRIVQQGEMGNALFVIISGCVACYLEEAKDFAGKSTVATSNAVDKLSKQFIVSRHAGEIFGELSIIWNTPRSLSVYAQEDCVLGRLERDVYQALVVHRTIRSREQHELCLRGAKLLETLSDEQIAKLADALELKTYQKGRAIINQGNDGKDFFIVQSGECLAKVKTGSDEQEHRRYLKGDLFGELALINKAPRAASIIAVTSVEVLRLSCRSFERMLGPLTLLQQDSYKTDPRKLIADFFRPGDTRGPFGSLQQLGIAYPEQPPSSWFAVFRPTSRDAIAKMLNGNAVGKGLNVKGKSAKKNRLSGYVPFVQISINDHKQAIEKMPDNSRVRVFYRNEAARQDAFERLISVQLDLRARRKQDRIVKVKMKNVAGSEKGNRRSSIKSNKSNRSRTSITSTESKNDAMRITFDDRYAPHAYGIFVPGNILQEVYIIQPDLSPTVDWETGRNSEPAFMDMNMHALCGVSSPQIVLYQHDEGDPMNPRGLLMAYAEKFVKPVVSDFDAFLVGSKGMHYIELPQEQTELVGWCLDAAYNILRSSSSDSWMSQWLKFLKSESKRGFHPKTPKFGFGDPTSVRLIEDVIAQTSACGAVRHGAECFNYYFPQDLDEEYLVVSDEFPGIPWKYMTEPELRQFLIERVHAGFSFPINPLWPVRDPGWYDVLSALRNSKHSGDNLRAWYPAEASILQKIDEIHAEFPDGFQVNVCKAGALQVQGNRPGGLGRSSCESPGGLGRSSCDVDLSLHQLQVGATKRSVGKFKRFKSKVWSGPSRSRSSWLPSGLSRLRTTISNWRGSATTETE